MGIYIQGYRESYFRTPSMGHRTPPGPVLNARLRLHEEGNVTDKDGIGAITPRAVWKRVV